MNDDREMHNGDADQIEEAIYSNTLKAKQQ